MNDWPFLLARPLLVGPASEAQGAQALYQSGTGGSRLLRRDKIAGVYRLKLPTLKVKDGSAVSMVFRYFPDEVDLPDQMIEIAKTFKDD
jgi:hypothetical protein